MASELSVVPSLHARKTALQVKIISRLRADLGFLNPPLHYAAARNRDKLIKFISIFSLAPSDVVNIQAVYVHTSHMAAPADLMRDVHLLVAWDNMVLQRWWRRWMKYRRFQRFIVQPRYSAYLNADGQLGRRFDFAQMAKWSQHLLR